MTFTRLFETSLIALLFLIPVEKGYGQVSVTPDGASKTVFAGSNGNTASFTVVNNGWMGETFSFTCSRTGKVSSCSSPGSVYIGPYGGQVNVNVTFNAGIAGSGTVTMMAAGGSSGSFDSGYYNVTVQAVSTTPPSNWDVTPFNQDNQGYGRCAGCGVMVASHSTVPYFSLDTPRNITLIYNSDRVRPYPLVQLDVKRQSGTPEEVWLQIKRGGQWQQFSNGEYTLKFTADPAGQFQRIAGQVNASALTTGMYDIEIIVTWLDNGNETPQMWATQLMVVNETTSKIAEGWTVAGVQRAYVQTNGDVLITEGDGSAVLFVNNGSGFDSPAGDFSRLNPYSGGWRREFTDSTDIRFSSAGLMTHVYDCYNNRMLYVYDGSQRLTKVQDPKNKYTSLVYWTYGLSQAYAPVHRKTYYTVGSNKRLTQIKDPDNKTTLLRLQWAEQLVVRGD